MPKNPGSPLVSTGQRRSRGSGAPVQPDKHGTVWATRWWE